MSLFYFTKSEKRRVEQVLLLGEGGLKDVGKGYLLYANGK
jgi:hypothetical protein